MTQYVRAINIANNSIKSFVFDTNTANTLNSAVVAEAVAISANVSAQAVNTFVTLQVQQLANTPPSINVISIADSSYNILDDTAANTGGAYLVITGTNFQSGAIVMVGSGNTALSTTYVDPFTLRAQIPAISSGSYPVYVVNSNGGTAIRINGLTTSSLPAWSTDAQLDNQFTANSFGINIGATSDSSITSYANTTVLPTGTTLLANGYFYGTLEITNGTPTTYTFDVKAIDSEYQENIRSFSITIVTSLTRRLWTVETARSSPTQVGPATGTSGLGWSQITTNASTSFSIAGIKTDGTLWALGRVNSEGQQGQNNTVNYSSPIQIGSNTNWSKVVAGQNITAAIKTDGTLWLWGGSSYNDNGLNNGSASVSSPTQLGSDTNWKNIVFGSYSAWATKTNGTLWAWGINGTGQLGINNRTSIISVPQQVGALTNWDKVGSGYTTMFAIKTDGTLWSCGSNSNGLIGTGTSNTLHRSSPVQVGALTDWSHFGRSSSINMLALKTDQSMWGWGNNQWSELGLTSYGAVRTSPVQLAGNWLKAAGGYNNSWGIKSDGTLWGWGYNINGGLGRNNRNLTVSPVQIGTGTLTNCKDLGSTFYYPWIIVERP